jgi:hypothetical protein
MYMTIDLHQHQITMEPQKVLCTSERAPVRAMTAPQQSRILPGFASPGTVYLQLLFVPRPRKSGQNFAGRRQATPT